MQATTQQQLLRSCAAATKVKRGNSGSFPFSVPALVFNAWAIDAFVGFCWAVTQGSKSVQLLLLGLRGSGQSFIKRGSVRSVIYVHLSKSCSVT